jgi:F-type H+-transporting ATPase subunit O
LNLKLWLNLKLPWANSWIQTKKLIISNKVNPSILGGLVVEIGNDKTIDLSVASKLAKLNKLLTGAI